MTSFFLGARHPGKDTALGSCPRHLNLPPVCNELNWTGRSKFTCRSSAWWAHLRAQSLCRLSLFCHCSCWNSALMTTSACLCCSKKTKQKKLPMHIKVLQVLMIRTTKVVNFSHIWASSCGENYITKSHDSVLHFHFLHWKTYFKNRAQLFTY